MRDPVPSDTTPEAWAVQRPIDERLGGQVRRAYARLVLGDTVAAALWPHSDLIEP